MARKIVLTSGKGGVGKTTLCFLLGRILAKKGNKVVLFDVDIGLNNLDVVSGVEKKVVFDIVDVALNKCRASQAVLDVDGCFNLFILPSAHPNNVGKVDLCGIQRVIEKLDKHFDYILIDCPAGIDYGFLRAVFCANEAIIVSTPHISALRDASKVGQILAGLRVENVSLVLNRVDFDLVRIKKQLDPFDVASTLNLPLSGIVAESGEILTASSIVGDLCHIKAEQQNGMQTFANNILNSLHLNSKQKFNIAI